MRRRRLVHLPNFACVIRIPISILWSEPIDTTSYIYDCRYWSQRVTSHRVFLTVHEIHGRASIHCASVKLPYVVRSRETSLTSYWNRPERSCYPAANWSLWQEGTYSANCCQLLRIRGCCRSNRLITFLFSLSVVIIRRSVNRNCGECTTSIDFSTLVV